MKILSVFVLLLYLCSGCVEREQAAFQDLSTAAGKQNVSPLTVVILGSSTASGIGASNYKYAWAGLLSSNFKDKNFVNLAKGGYTTYHILPNSTKPQANRPAVDTSRNITAALKVRPTILIVSMTTNDIYFGHTVDEIVTNIKAIRTVALANGVRYFIVTTPHPRRINASFTKKYIEQRDRILSTFKSEAVNFFDAVADSTNNFRPELVGADGIHPNDAGHAILYGQIKEPLARIK